MATVSPAVLASRLRQSRESVGLTQSQVEEQLPLPRNARAQSEAGERQVRSTELHALAQLYGREMAEFFQPEFDSNSPLLALFREQLGAELQPALLQTAGRFLELGRRLDRLERDLRFARHPSAPVAREAAAEPRGIMDAVRQGEALADRERGRLGLGTQPVADLAELLETQGVRTLAAELPEGVDGMTLHAPEISPFVVVGAGGVIGRRRFSLAHEYAHVLLDRARGWMVSRRENQKDLREVRANAFASSFLMPAAGVEEFMHGLGKPRRRNTSAVYEGDGLRSVRNTEPGEISEVQAFDVVQLAAYFQVSREAALFRLANLDFVKPGDRDGLQNQVRERGAELARLMGVREEVDGQESMAASRHRLFGLLLEALRREEVSRRWALESIRMAGFEAEDFEQAIEAAGLQDPPADVLLPEGLL